MRKHIFPIANESVHRFEKPPQRHRSGEQPQEAASHDPNQGSLKDSVGNAVYRKNISEPEWEKRMLRQHASSRPCEYPGRNRHNRTNDQEVHPLIPRRISAKSLPTGKPSEPRGKVGCVDRNIGTVDLNDRPGWVYRDAVPCRANARGLECVWTARLHSTTRSGHKGGGALRVRKRQRR